MYKRIVKNIITDCGAKKYLLMLRLGVRKTLPAGPACLSSVQLLSPIECCLPGHTLLSISHDQGGDHDHDQWSE